METAIGLLWLAVVCCRLWWFAVGLLLGCGGLKSFCGSLMLVSDRLQRFALYL